MITSPASPTDLPQLEAESMAELLSSDRLRDMIDAARSYVGANGYDPEPLDVISACEELLSRRADLRTASSQPVEQDVRRSYHTTIGRLLELLNTVDLSPEHEGEIDKIAEEHSWDGLSCGCGGGWLVGHRSGCPEGVASARVSANAERDDGVERERDEYRNGLNALANCQSSITRSQMREAAADILRSAGSRVWSTEDQSPFVIRAQAAEARVASLEAAAPSTGEVTEALHLFREFVLRNATQWKLGAGHQHPIWAHIAELLDGAQGVSGGPEWKFIDPENRETLNNLRGTAALSSPVSDAPIDAPIDFLAAKEAECMRP